MIRIETGSVWTLVEHREHARLAGHLAAHWGNAEFAAPEPRADILEAVFHHDDAWTARDSDPRLTRQGRPSAFSEELVGKYSAFEEIDLEDYLAVRGRAAEVVAADNPYAAVIISMHTVDLLTRQADLSGLSKADLAIHQAFIAGQRRRQQELIGQVGGRTPADAVVPERLLRAFEFLQACDSLSLVACVRFPRPIALQHKHPRRDGTLAVLQCSPLGNDAYRIGPFPFDTDVLRLGVPCREVPAGAFSDEAGFRSAYLAAPVRRLEFQFQR
jgi:hypothetical protein